ncbi:MAG: hypothetical protein FWD33_03875 [Alphaproteobacteria bacterium]|nr:hypothetical protein [Alphaproteobacteria bacterium]
MAWVVYDLDNGIVCDSPLRGQAKTTGGAIKTEWYKNAPLRVNSRIISHLRNQKGRGHRVCIITSRYGDKEGIELTKKWLRSLSIPYDKIIFRETNNSSPDSVFKPWALVKNSLSGAQVVCYVSETRDLESALKRIGVKFEVV